MQKPTSTQLGAIAENLVANALMIHSGGRLSPFVALADDDGIDLLVYDKDTGGTTLAQIKSRTVTLYKKGGQRGNVVHFQIRRATLRGDRHACAILVLLSADLSKIECAWVMPMREVKKLALQRERVFVVRASKAPESADKFSAYRCSGPELAGRVLALIEKLGGPV